MHQSKTRGQQQNGGGDDDVVDRMYEYTALWIVEKKRDFNYKKKKI